MARRPRPSLRSGTCHLCDQDIERGNRLNLRSGRFSGLSREAVLGPSFRTGPWDVSNSFLRPDGTIVIDRVSRSGAAGCLPFWKPRPSLPCSPCRALAGPGRQRTVLPDQGPALLEPLVGGGRFLSGHGRRPPGVLFHLRLALAVAAAAGVAWVGRLLTWSLLAWAWRRLSRAVTAGPWMAVLSAGLFSLLLDRAAMAGEWVIGGVEAKGFAYVLVFLALEALVRGRWGRAWLILAPPGPFTCWWAVGGRSRRGWAGRPCGRTGGGSRGWRPCCPIWPSGWCWHCPV